VYPIRVAHCASDGTRLIRRRGQAANVIGRVLDGKFEVRAPIGEGVLGAVYLGWQRTIDREVAIKIMRPGLADAAAADRFIEAARVACQLAAGSIVTTYDFGRTDDGLLYVVMELIRGRTLADDIRERPLPFHRAVAIGIQICDALDVASKHGTVHGDLKPTNILLVDETTRRDVVKVTDLGIAAAFALDVPSGEPIHARYFAPERATGAPPSVASDLYALGCILHEAITGAPPFVASSMRELLDKHANELPPRLPPKVPSSVTAIVSTLLAKTPAKRFETIAAARRALHTAQGTTPATGIQVSGDPSGPRGPVTGAHTRPPITGHSQPPITGHSQPPITGHSQPGYAPSAISSVYPQSAIGGGQPHPPVTGIHPPAPSSTTRVIVIVVVALVVSGLGIAAYVLAS
jgi:serine/threonine-protein kinase